MNRKTLSEKFVANLKDILNDGNKKEPLTPVQAKPSISDAITNIIGNDPTQLPVPATGQDGQSQSSAIASPLTEQSRTEVDRTITSTDGLFEITFKDATSVTFNDANNRPVVLRFSDQS